MLPGQDENFRPRFFEITDSAQHHQTTLSDIAEGDIRLEAWEDSIVTIVIAT